MNDYISRQAAIEALHTRFKDGFNEDKWWNSTHVLAAIEGLPPAQPKRGRWIIAKEQRREDTENGNYMYNCSNCGCGDLHSKAVKVSYCWNCGADMRGEQDG